MDFDIILEIINFFYANKHLYERMNGIKPYYTPVAQWNQSTRFLPAGSGVQVSLGVP